MYRRFLTGWHLLPVAALVLLMAGACAVDAGTAESEDVEPHSGLAPCSDRQSLVRTGRIVPGQPLERMLKSSFGTTRTFGEENIEPVAGSGTMPGYFRVRYPEGSINFGSAGKGKKGRPLGGASFYAPYSRARTLCLHYQVRFPRDFAFVKGGKLPGLYGGKAPSGGEKVTGRNGWSVRLMWRKEGQGELYEYIVNKDEDYGLSVGRGLFTFPRGRWVGVDLEVVLNDPGKRNGIARLWIDGRAVIEQDNVVYTTRKRASEAGLMFSTFFGGSDSSWATPKDQHVDFRNFRMYAGDDE